MPAPCAPDSVEPRPGAQDPGSGRREDARVPQGLRGASDPRQDFLPMSVLIADSGEERRLSVCLHCADVPGDNGDKLARPALDRGAQGGK
eukprot:319541-Alexandrium_andersonii.AAC.1